MQACLRDIRLRYRYQAPEVAISILPTCLRIDHGSIPNFAPEWGADRAKQALGGDFASFTAVGTTLDSGRPVLVATRDHREGSAQRADPKFLQTTTAAMMTVCRYASAVAIFLVVSLTPRSCADISEPAMAAEEPVKSVVNETVHQPVDEASLEIEDVAEAIEIGS